METHQRVCPTKQLISRYSFLFVLYLWWTCDCTLNKLFQKIVLINSFACEFSIHIYIFPFIISTSVEKRRVCHGMSACFKGGVRKVWGKKEIGRDNLSCLFFPSVINLFHLFTPTQLLSLNCSLNLLTLSQFEIYNKTKANHHVVKYTSALNMVLEMLKRPWGLSDWK